jgi:hypothetical protein
MNKEVEYLKEHLYEIYKSKKSMKDLTYDMDIEHLLRACKALDYSQKEIERLNNIINELEKDIRNLYTYGIKNNAEQRDYLLNRLEGLKEFKGSD